MPFNLTKSTSLLETTTQTHIEQIPRKVETPACTTGHPETIVSLKQHFHVPMAPKASRILLSGSVSVLL